MKKIVIGTAGEAFDLQLLLATRLLVQAGSGGGKSYLIRRLVEQLFGHVQVIIVDPEGEFATLREKFDFVLVGKDGETPADVRSAALLAEKLLELNASAICDIYEMRATDRHRWVKLFCDALVNAPKHLWHPVVVIIDECHLFAPEKGAGESEALGAVMDLATRGRKRGFALVAATQRLGKLSKNVSAELQNVLIGSTFQDIDRKRAEETLGVARADSHQFNTDVKMLKPGEFFALGRAISNERIRLRIAPVSTSHPVSGKYKATPPAPSDRVKALLPQLADLPAEADAKLRTVAELKAEIVELKRAAKTLPPLPTPKIKEVAVLKDSLIARFEAGVKEYQTICDKHEGTLVKFWVKFDKVTTEIQAAMNNHKRVLPHAGPEKYPHHQIVQPIPKKASSWILPPGNSSGFDGKLPIGEEKILTACIQFPEGLERSQLTVLTGYKRSSRDAYIARLAQKGFVTVGERIFTTPAGQNALPNFQPLPEGKELQDYWMRELPEGEKKILECLISRYPSAMVRDDLDEQTGYKRSSRDAYLARLSAKNLVMEAGRGSVKATDNLFEAKDRGF